MLSRRHLIQAAAGVTAMAAEGAARAQVPPAAARRGKVIDVHTHMYTTAFLTALQASGDSNFKIGQGPQYRRIEYRGRPIANLYPAMTDWAMRLNAMDHDGIDIAVISLTAPNVYWGTAENSRQAAKVINDEYAEAQARYGERIRWYASLPWDDAEAAIRELHRAKAQGAVGVCTLTNILGRPLTDERYRPVWREIEAQGLPTFVHPTDPVAEGLGLEHFGLGTTVGFTSETSLCFARMIVSGFMDELPNLQMIACHAGGGLPYLIGRLEYFWHKDSSERQSAISPKNYLSRLWYDALAYDQPTMNFLVEQVGYDRVLYGSDYPFLIADPVGVLERTSAFSSVQREAILSGNAARLFKL
ncbi:MAG TPA: amidohydrolase family protein [Caulobacteraceae bacterium]|jgi:aminocarboxymuconate-semialdehyde decarboxylase|nr:amidohydrolase family protein [Caulobacteraceae bacterium]